jgi:methylated-DNA-[protein]-cysteine S-methyltransferase
VSDGETTWTTYDSAVGPLVVVAGPAGISRIAFPGAEPPAGALRAPMPAVTDQLDAYFTGELLNFDLPLDPRGAPLDLLVWNELRSVPYGGTITYGEMASRIDPSAYPEGIEPYMRARLVGAALGRNPIVVVVPCHRVIGADGSLVGFGGGIDRKRALLELEGVDLGGQPAGPGPRTSQLELL